MGEDNGAIASEMQVGFKSVRSDRQSGSEGLECVFGVGGFITPMSN